MNSLSIPLPKLEDDESSTIKTDSSPTPSSDETAFDDPRIYSKINKILLNPPYVLAKLSQELPERALEHFIQTVPSRIGVRDIHAEMTVEPGLSSSLVIYEASPSPVHDTICSKLAELIKRNTFFGNYVRQCVFVTDYGRAPDGCLVVPNSPSPPCLNSSLSFLPQPSVIWEVAFDEDESTLCSKLADAIMNPKLGNIRSAIGIKVDRVDPETNNGFSVGPRMVAIHCRRTRHFTGMTQNDDSEGEEDPDAPPPLMAMKAEFGDVENWGDAVLELPYSDVFLNSTMPNGEPVPEGAALIDLFALRCAIQPYVDGTIINPLPTDSIENYEEEVQM